MTEKLLTFPSPTPLSYLPGPWGLGLKVEIQLFSSTASTQPNTTKDICTGTPCADPGIFCQGGGWVWGSRLLNLFYSLKRGSNGFITHFPGGRGPTFSRGGGPIETHITITCDFPGVWTPYPPSGSAHGHCGILAQIGSDEPVLPPFKLRNFKC